MDSKYNSNQDVIANVRVSIISSYRLLQQVHDKATLPNPSFLLLPSRLANVGGNTLDFGLSYQLSLFAWIIWVERRGGDARVYYRLLSFLPGRLPSYRGRKQHLTIFLHFIYLDVARGARDDWQSSGRVCTGGGGEAR